MVEVEIKSAVEPWTVLELSDGTRIKIRLNVSLITRDDTDVSPDGTPRYEVRWETSIAVMATDATKKAALSKKQN